MGAFALVYLTLYLLSALICGTVFVYTWQRQTVNGAVAYGWLALNQTIQILFFLIETLSVNKETKLFWDSLQWINTALLPVNLVWFVWRYTGGEVRHPRRLWALTLFGPLLFILAIITNPWHGWVIDISWVKINWPFTELVYTFTPLDEIFVGWAYLIAASAIGFFFLHTRQLTYPGNHQTLVLILAMLIPYGAGVAILLGLQIGPFRDFTPFAYALANLFAIFGLYRIGLFDLAPIARDLVVENLPDEVMVIDARNRLVYLNTASARRLEQPKDSLIGQSIETLYQDWPELLAHLKNPIEAEAFSVLGRSGDTRAYQLRATPLRGRFGRPGGLLILINDVTRLKAVEAELVQHRQYLARLVKQRTAELQQALDDLQVSKQDLERRVTERTAELAAQNRELETFAYSVSHDLKAPLRGIDGYSRLLLDGYEDQIDAEGRGFLRNIRQATTQMYQLIEDLLAYSRFQRRSFSYQSVDVCQLVTAVLSEFEDEIAQRPVTISTRLECREVYVEVEGLSQALRNLVDNALKFTHSTPHPQIEIGVVSNSEGCRLWVKDNGIGLDMLYQDRIFEIFQRLHRSEEYPGTGIGLALVQKAVQRMAGRVWVESAPDCGATFYIQLPLQTTAPPMVQ